jgi:acyl carrier protein
MNIVDAKKNVKKVISETIDGDEEITDEMQLIGGDSLLDSMELVEVCLALEDLANDNGFEFDWTSDATMSKTRSMFRTVKSLAEEFSTQSEV